MLLTPARYILDSGAYLTLLNDDPLSSLLQVPTSLADERLTFACAHSRSEFAEAWTKACKGLRSEEVDVAFFPISQGILREESVELRQLEAMISTIPLNLRPRQMQPCLILFDVNFNMKTRRDLHNLETILSTLVQDCWNRDQLTSNDTQNIFQNFTLVQPGGWFSWNRLRVYLWQTPEGAAPYFGKTPHLVPPENLLNFVLEPPEMGTSVWGNMGNIVGRVVGIDDLTLLTFVSGQTALTSYFIYRLAWKQ
ncbi:hypothetical protein BDY19DRAFT_93637 [Irpex rosettiformis]|uniref:Uncharacterized protein n=1 Tax=Irpex rosettiformis TaxID=378272 RepID=A0ACB8U6K8_9APHY|nr:hypothetical protein BDY19DRAFT_93637 [Irpex rosettiformis]